MKEEPGRGVVRTGGCLCGAARFEVGGEPTSIAACHCRMCQRWSAGPFAAAARFQGDSVVWVGDISLFRSSKAVSRSFCPTCGSALGFHSGSGTVWITLGSFDNPGQFEPWYHMFADEELPWAHLEDGRPRYGQSGPT